MNKKPVKFNDFLFDAEQIENKFRNYDFKNQRPITKSMLTWWAFQDNSQKYLPLEKTIEIEHIYAKNRQKIEQGLTNPNNIDSLGNKSILEKKVNIRASDYKFSDKIKYYQGFTTTKGEKEGTDIKELLDISNTMNDFTETDIGQRETKIILKFIEYLKNNDLLKN